MEKVGKTTPLESTKETEQKLSSAIMLAVEIKSAFEMYAYRVISPESFQERLQELTEFYKSQQKT